MEKFSKILKFADKDGNKHSYMANFIDGEISPEDKRNIEKLKNGERLEEKKETSTSDNEIVNDFAIDAIKDNFTPPGAEDEDELYDQMESMGDLPSDMQLHKALKKADTNDNGEIEVDEMADFQKSLDDYAAKNKKGRDDIPVATRRR